MPCSFQPRKIASCSASAEVQRTRELAIVEPVATLDNLTVEDGNLAGGAAKGNESELHPEAEGFGKRRRQNISEAPGSAVVLFASRDSMKSPVIISS